MTDRGATFSCLLLGGLLALVATSQAWWRAAGGGASVSFSGTEASGGVSQALAVVSLAGTLLVLVLQARGRRVLAVLLGLTGLGVVAVALLRRAPGGEAVRTRMRSVSLTDAFTMTSTPWPAVFAVAGLIVLAGASLLWRGAPRWVPQVDRFKRGTPPEQATTRAVNAEDDPGAVWRALDAGLDPTTTEDAPDAGPHWLPDRPQVPTADVRGDNGEQDHTATEAVRSTSRPDTSRTGRPSPRTQGD
ncbi:MAG TPA: Trp biosynthesis-associated membrane protein [Propionibacteriaceae bacterium]|nr:Trp biosynthesis-associated membrane protein [Propionibacteriaceae bacterium]